MYAALMASTSLSTQDRFAYPPTPLSPGERLVADAFQSLMYQMPSQQQGRELAQLMAPLTEPPTSAN